MSIMVSDEVGTLVKGLLEFIGVPDSGQVLWAAERVRRILEADRKGRELPDDKLEKIRKELEEDRDSEGDFDYRWEADRLLAHITFQAALIADLKSTEGDGSAAYQRGVEDERKRCVAAILEGARADSELTLALEHLATEIGGLEVRV
jgi:hypothetical protein